jgi:hypothetical protein
MILNLEFKKGDRVVYSKHYLKRIRADSSMDVSAVAIVDKSEHDCIPGAMCVTWEATGDEMSVARADFVLESEKHLEPE